MRIITRLNVGGPSYQAIYLSERLAGSFETDLLAGRVGAREGSLESLAGERGVAPRKIPGLGREIHPLRDIATLQRVYREIRRFKPDIVHTHLAKAGTVGRLAARLARTPVVIHTYHGHVFHGYFGPAMSRAVVRIERGLARLTDRLVVLGEAQEREILGFGVGTPAQMVRIPLGLELEPFLAAERLRGELRSELGMSPDTPLVGIVARLVPVKAHRLFLDAARRIAREAPGARFVLVGDGELRAELEAEVARCGPEGVQFLGFRSDLAKVYADLDVVVLTSVNEGLPVSVIEALASARPVVATAVGSVGDLVTDGVTGRLVPSGDAPALAGAVGELLRDPEGGRAMGLAGRAHVYPRLSIERLVQDIRGLYEGLLASCPRRRTGV